MTEGGDSVQGRSGFVAIVGRPNVGKSTLLNRILGQKISITSRKPQTTRHRILGIKTRDRDQVIYVDTPGLHEDQGRALNRSMNRAVGQALRDVDLVLFMVDRDRWTPEDERILERLSTLAAPLVLLVNKVDRMEHKDKLLPHLERLSGRHDFAEILPLSAKRGHNVEALEEALLKYLPEGPHYFPEDQVTDRSSRFLAAELVREKIMRQLGDELPYQVNVEIEAFSEEDGGLDISALVLVERRGQKKILIGQGGERIRAIGREARLDMEKMFELPVMLRLWVKVKSGWSNDERALRSLGYEDVR